MHLCNKQAVIHELTALVNVTTRMGTNGSNAPTHQKQSISRHLADHPILLASDTRQGLR